jgi:hypothetical protein
MIKHEVNSNVFAYLPECGQSGCGISHLEKSKFMLQCGNIVHLTLKLLDVAKFTNLTPLSLLISCKFSFPIVDLQMSFLPTLALKFPNRIFIWYLRNYEAHVAIPPRSSPSQHQVYLLLGHERSEQGNDTSGL